MLFEVGRQLLTNFTKSGPSHPRRKNTAPPSGWTPPPVLMDSTWDSGLCQLALKTQNIEFSDAKRNNN